MYESFFGLSHRPFTAAPHADAYIPTASHEQSRQTLIRCLDRAEGPALLIGPSGTGKSLLCHLLAKHFRGRFQIALLSSARLSTRKHLLQCILFELRLPYRDMDEGELRLSLIDHLQPSEGGPEGLLLLVDEAHTLPLRLLEEIRLLSNLVRDGQTRIRLVLSGGMALEERLANPKLESLHQRIAARCYLQPCGRDETIYYVQQQLRRAGGDADALLTGDAQSSIHTATDGIPRLINQLCDHALLLSALSGIKPVPATGIEEAWADLQQLPVPLHEPPTLARSGGSHAAGMVEFGQLPDERAVVAGTIGPSLGDAAVLALDQISSRVDALRSDRPDDGMLHDGGADDFCPASAGGTEVELIFHTAHDPFGGHWDEEEVVIDRYASLEDAALRTRHRVTSAEGMAVGVAVQAALQGYEANNPYEAMISDEAAEPSTRLEFLASAAGQQFEPANDPLMPEEPAAPHQSRPATISLREFTEDDRDMIIVEDDPAPRSPKPSGGHKRQEYRQLFSTLRNR